MRQKNNKQAKGKKRTIRSTVRESARALAIEMRGTIQKQCSAT